MTKKNLSVAEGLAVSLDYTLSLDDGEIIDSSQGTTPLVFLCGYDQVIPGLERELLGMVVGQEKSVTVAPGDAYGEIDEDAFEQVPRTVFPADMGLEVDMQMNMRDAKTGEVLRVRVAEVESETVLLDLNHPLAGETLHFDVRIADLRPATESELAHGHVHGNGHDH